jgi:hypothetical protein
LFYRLFKTGRTPVLSAEETPQPLVHIDLNTIAGTRDPAIIGVMVYSFARVGAVVGMNVVSEPSLESLSRTFRDACG